MQIARMQKHREEGWKNVLPSPGPCGNVHLIPFYTLTVNAVNL